MQRFFNFYFFRRLEGIEDAIMESLPPRVFSNLNEVQRNDLFTYVDNPGSSHFISESVVGDVPFAFKV